MNFLSREIWIDAGCEPGCQQSVIKHTYLSASFQECTRAIAMTPEWPWPIAAVCQAPAASCQTTCVVKIKSWSILNPPWWIFSWTILQFFFCTAEQKAVAAYLENIKQLPRKYKTFVWHLYNVGPASKTLDRRCINVIQMFCVCRVTGFA